MAEAHVHRVSLVDGQIRSQRIIKLHLTGSREFRLGRHYRSAEDALRGVPVDPADLILINARLPGMCGIECAHKLKKVLPKLPVVMFAKEVELPGFIRALLAGADGYFIVSGKAESLEQVLSNALAGWKPFPREIQKMLVGCLMHASLLPAVNGALTPTERKIMAYLVLGLSDKEIATLTGNATATIHSVTNRIFKKLDVHSRREAVSVHLGFKRGMKKTALP